MTRSHTRYLIGLFVVLALAAVLQVVIDLSRAQGRESLLPPSSSALAVQARAALSLTNGKLKLHGLHHPVTVFRDPWGVPHIYAEDQHDLFFG